MAGMDRSVAPGDDFFAYANGTWAKTAEIPPDRSTWGVPGGRGRPRAAAHARAARRARRPGHEPGLRTIAKSRTTSPATWTKPRSKRKGSRRSSRSSTKSRRSGSRGARAWVCGALRSDVDALNADELLHRSSVRPLGRRRRSTIRRTTRRTCSRAASGMPDRDYYLEPAPDMDGSATPIAPTSRTSCALAGVGDPDSRGRRASSRSRRRSRESTRRGPIRST